MSAVEIGSAAEVDNDSGVLIAGNRVPGLLSKEDFRDDDCPVCMSTLMFGKVTTRFENVPTEAEQYPEGRIEGSVNVKICTGCGYLKALLEIAGYDGY